MVEAKDCSPHGWTLDTLEEHLDGLRARNLRPVRLDTLVGGPAYQPCDKSSS